MDGVAETNNRHSRINIDLRISVLFVLLVVVACLPIWSVTYFLGQDEPAHLHSASILVKLLTGTDEYGGFYMLQPPVIPNSTGHWILALLMLVFSPVVAGKVIITGIYASFVAVCVWLRWSTRGSDHLALALLIGAVLGLNWFWLTGLYNFLIGAIVFIFVNGLLYFWAGELNWRRLLILMPLFLAAYFSHLVPFTIMIAALVLYLLMRAKFRSLIWLLVALVPILPFAAVYRGISETGGEVQPTWYVVNEAFSFSSILLHLRATDAFQIISRRFIPFSDSTSQLNIAAAPIIWIGLAFLILGFSTLSYERLKPRIGSKFIAHGTVIAVVILLALISPDGFGSDQGSVLRPRLLLLGMVLFVPIFVVSSRRVTSAASIVLAAMFIYQVAGLWEYSLKVDRELDEYFSADQWVGNDGLLASISVLDGPVRFHSEPVSRAAGLFGVGRHIAVLDNYETGFYFFPVIAADPDDRTLIRDFTAQNAIRWRYQGEDHEEQLGKLSSVLELSHERLRTLIVWGRDERVDAIVGRWFGSTPVFEGRNIRVFRKSL